MDKVAFLEGYNEGLERLIMSAIYKESAEPVGVENHPVEGVVPAAPRKKDGMIRKTLGGAGNAFGAASGAVGGTIAGGAGGAALGSMAGGVPGAVIGALLGGGLGGTAGTAVGGNLGNALFRNASEEPSMGKQIKEDALAGLAGLTPYIGTELHTALGPDRAKGSRISEYMARKGGKGIGKLTGQLLYKALTPEFGISIPAPISPDAGIVAKAMRKGLNKVDKTRKAVSYALKTTPASKKLIEKALQAAGEGVGHHLYRQYDKKAPEEAKTASEKIACPQGGGAAEPRGDNKPQAENVGLKEGKVEVAKPDNPEGGAPVAGKLAHEIILSAFAKKAGIIEKDKIELAKKILRNPHVQRGLVGGGMGTGIGIASGIKNPIEGRGRLASALAAGAGTGLGGALGTGIGSFASGQQAENAEFFRPDSALGILSDYNSAVLPGLFGVGGMKSGHDIARALAKKKDKSVAKKASEIPQGGGAAEPRGDNKPKAECACPAEGKVEVAKPENPEGGAPAAGKLASEIILSALYKKALSDEAKELIIKSLLGAGIQGTAQGAAGAIIPVPGYSRTGTALAQALGGGIGGGLGALGGTLADDVLNNEAPIGMGVGNALGGFGGGMSARGILMKNKADKSNDKKANEQALSKKAESELKKMLLNNLLLGGGAGTALGAAHGALSPVEGQSALKSAIAEGLGAGAGATIGGTGAQAIADYPLMRLMGMGLGGQSGAHVARRALGEKRSINKMLQQAGIQEEK